MPTDSDSNSAPATPESSHSSDFITSDPFNSNHRGFAWNSQQKPFLDWSTPFNDAPDLVLEDLLCDSVLEPDPLVTESVPHNKHPTLPFPRSHNFVKPEPLAPLFSDPQQGVASRVVTPPRDSCSDLPIIVRNIPQTGAKSRVETQIRLTLDLSLAPASTSASNPDPDSYDKVGSWKWLRLPPGTTTKKRPRKEGKIDPQTGETLFLSAQVFCASPPHTRVFSCSSCQQRETKRTARKQAARVRPSRDDALEESLAIGDKDKVIQYTCPDLLEFSTGSVALPFRITCYCRHHREKLGFRVMFTMKDENGRVVGHGATPPIMITDDHKTAGPSSKNQNTPDEDEHESTSPPVRKRRAIDNDDIADARTRRRAHPYGQQLMASHRRGSTSGPSFSPYTTAPPSPVLSPERSLPSPLSLSGKSSLADISGLPYPDGLDALMAGAHLSFPQLSLFSPSLPMPAQPEPPFSQAAPRPVIHRLIPCSGPTHGGIEITILGTNFHPNMSLSCVFGDVVASSLQRWSENTLVCVLPARACAGVVRVAFEGIPEDTEEISNSGRMFTYVDENDRALMELALQVVGLRMTGKIEEAKNVAMRIVNDSAGSNTQTPGLNSGIVTRPSHFPPSVGFDSRSLLLVHDPEDFQKVLVSFLSAFDVPASVNPTIRNELSLRTQTGQTLLHFASALNLTTLVTCLVDRGIDIDARDINGFTALHFAAIGGSTSCGALLLAAGSDKSLVDAHGRTALEVATPEFLSAQQAWCRMAQVESGDEGDDERFSSEDDCSLESCTKELPLRYSNESLDPDDESIDLQTSKTLPSAANHGPPLLPNISSGWLQRHLIASIPAMPTMPWGIQLHLPGIPLPNYAWLTVREKKIVQHSALYDLYVPWRASWEKWVLAQSGSRDEVVPMYQAISTENGISNDDVDEHSVNSTPPGNHSYPPRTSRRLDYADVQVSDGEVNSYAFQSQKVRKLQKDRMLMLFWGPVLFIVLAAGLYHSIPLAFRQLGRRVQDYLPTDDSPGFAL